MASYIEKFKSYTDWGTVIVRSNDTPLDRSSIFGSYEDAVNYAKGDGSDTRGLGKTSYVGQIITVFENDVVDIYQIKEDKTLKKVIHEFDVENLKTEINQKIDELINNDKQYEYNDSNTISFNVEENGNKTIIDSNVKLQTKKTINDVECANIIFKETDGLFAHVDVTYDALTNILTFSNGVEKKEFDLFNHSFIENIHYDNEQKKLVLTVKLSDDNTTTQEIDLGNLFNYINFSNDVNSPITFNRENNDENGVDTITAHLNISSNENNLIQLKKEENNSVPSLFVSNSAETIKVNWYDVNENEEIINPQNINVQDALINVIKSLNNFTTLKDNYDKALQRIEELENKFEVLTDFGYTDEN